LYAIDRKISIIRLENGTLLSLVLSQNGQNDKKQKKKGFHRELKWNLILEYWN
jgi:hypothetical protein